MHKPSVSSALRRFLVLQGVFVLFWSGCGAPESDGGSSDDVESVSSALVVGGGIKVNCGGPAVAPFVADTNATGGTQKTRTNVIDLSGVTNPAPMAVYQSQRFGNETYNFVGLNPGQNNTIRLHFAETNPLDNAVGKRVFNVSINGTPVLSGFDIFAAAGLNKAIVRQFTATADANGAYAIVFSTITDQATVSGIEVLPPAVTTGTWSAVAAETPISLGNGLQMQVLTDGSVLMGDNAQANTWFRLAPDSKGSYEKGTWSQLASSHFSRAFGPSTMLNDGRYLIGGGEDLAGVSNTYVDIYDPFTNMWTLAPPMPKPIGDTAASILPDGRFYCSSLSGPETFLYNPSTNAWTQGPDIGTGGSGDEKGWLLMQNGKVIDIFNTASIYDPTAGPVVNGLPIGAWTATAPMLAGMALVSGVGSEIGALLQLYTGKVLQLGGAAHNDMAGNEVADTGQTAIYDPANDTWTQGANAPDGLQWGDTSAAVMINGRVINSTSNSIVSNGSSANIYEYDPLAPNGGTFTSIANNVTPDPNGPHRLNFPQFMQLPSGQILVADGSDVHLRLYMPAGGQAAVPVAWKPTLTSLSAPVSGVYTLTGTQLNGLTNGGAFGDDRNMATAYPIVYLTDALGNRFYARSFGFDQMAPRAKATDSCSFTLPTSLPSGTYAVHVSGNGVESANTLPLTVSGLHVKAITGPGVQPNGSTTWTVFLSGNAPQTGTIVNLASDDTRVVTVFPSVTVPPFASQVNISVVGRGYGSAHITAATAVANSQFIAASAMFGWSVASVYEKPGIPPTVSALPPTSPTTGTNTWTVNIIPAAPPGGVVVTIRSDNTAGATPPSVTVPAGATSATFTVGRGTWVGGLSTITGSLLNSSKSNWSYSYNATIVPTDLPLL